MHSTVKESNLNAQSKYLFITLCTESMKNKIHYKNVAAFLFWLDWASLHEYCCDINYLGRGV